MYKKLKNREIAELANVSTATVSRVLNDSPSVKESTKRRIMAIVNKMEAPDTYKPHSKLILASFPELSNPFYSEIFNGINDAAETRGYKVLFVATKNYSSPEAYHFFLNNDFYAGMIIAHSIPTPNTLDKLKARFPVVMCSEKVEHEMASVTIDDYYSTTTVMKYLISTGHKRIALVNSSLRNHYAAKREAAYRACLTEAGLTIREDWIVHLSDISYSLSLSYARELLSRDDRPDAFFCISDVYAAAVINVAHAVGLKVPDDVSVIGFDNIDISTMITPSITTISQPRYQIGNTACNMLLDIIEYPVTQPKQVVLGTELLLRESTIIPRLNDVTD